MKVNRFKPGDVVTVHTPKSKELGLTMTVIAVRDKAALNIDTLGRLRWYKTDQLMVMRQAR